MIDDLTPIEFFRRIFLFDFGACFVIYAMAWPLGVNKLVGTFLFKSIK